MSRSTPRLTARFESACRHALRLHADQVRKASGTPYASHLFAVAALVLEDGADEDVAIAALLHDAVEDQGGHATREEIGRRFGPRVEDIVVGCSDTLDGRKLRWRSRKERFIASLEQAPREVLQVVAADKLHNARSFLRDHAALGEKLWKQFRGGRDGTLWYFREITEVLRRRYPDSFLVEELAEATAALEQCV